MTQLPIESSKPASIDNFIDPINTRTDRQSIPIYSSEINIMSELLKPQFFVVRQNGNIVPLIAMDEMPHNIRVEGVSRNMTIKDTTGMTNIGEYPSRHGQHQIRDTNKASATYTYPSTRPRLTQDARHDEQNVSEKSTKLPVDLFTPSTKLSYGITEQPPSESESDNTFKIPTTNKPVAEAFGKFDPPPHWKNLSEVEGHRTLPPGKKVYCSHWMSTGECDYAQQGCKYKHEMPLDLETLNLLGYKDVPKWYRESFGIGSLSAVPGSGAAMSGSTFRSNAMFKSPRPSRYAPVNSSSDQESARPNNKAWRGRDRTRELPQHRDHRPRQTRTVSLVDADRIDRAPRSRNAKDVRTAISQLFDSKYAHARPTKAVSTLVRVTPVTTFKKPARNMISAYNPHSTQTSTASPSPDSEHVSRTRSTSIFSDAETEFIRANDLRRANEEAEYAVTVAKAKAEKAAKLKKETDETAVKEEGEKEKEA